MQICLLSLKVKGLRWDGSAVLSITVRELVYIKLYLYQLETGKRISIGTYKSFIQ
jgi:hypothetical protein